MAEGTGLENRHTGEPGIVSSNLTLSVCTKRLRPLPTRRFLLLKLDRDGNPSKASGLHCGGCVFENTRDLHRCVCLSQCCHRDCCPTGISQRADAPYGDGVGVHIVHAAARDDRSANDACARVGERMTKREDEGAVSPCV